MGKLKHTDLQIDSINIFVVSLQLQKMITSWHTFNQNFAYPVGKVKNNADVRQNIFENYVNHRELMVSMLTKNLIVMLRVTIGQTYFIFSNEA